MCKSCCKIHRSQISNLKSSAGTIALICGIEAEQNSLQSIWPVQKSYILVLLWVILDSQTPGLSCRWNPYVSCFNHLQPSSPHVLTQPLAANSDFRKTHEIRREVWLVVGPPLWKIWKSIVVNWDDDIPNKWENKKWQPNHQPGSLWNFQPQDFPPLASPTPSSQDLPYRRRGSFRRRSRNGSWNLGATRERSLLGESDEPNSLEWVHHNKLTI